MILSIGKNKYYTTTTTTTITNTLIGKLKTLYKRSTKPFKLYKIHDNINIFAIEKSATVIITKATSPVPLTKELATNDLYNNVCENVAN